MKTQTNEAAVSIRHKQPSSGFHIIGHRGCAGLMPENTIAGFIEAVKMGVTPEIDVMATADGEIIVSNEYFITPETSIVNANKGGCNNIYNMNYADIEEFDCGTKTSMQYPYRKSIPAVKPLLNDVVQRIEKFTLWNNLKPAQYIIDIRTMPHTDFLLHPSPEDIVIRIIDIMRTMCISRRTVIMSADYRPLQLFRRLDKNVSIALTADHDLSVEENISELGFTPDIYTANFRCVDTQCIKIVQKRGMLLIPYVVNELLDMNELMQMGVNGIITDYPDIALSMIE